MDLQWEDKEVAVMMLPIAGSIRNSVKLAEMDSKWQQKKKNGGKSLKMEMSPQEKQIQRYKEDLERMREGRQMSDIDAKLKAGGTLTPEEITYLQRNCPEKYKEYVEIKNEREAYKRQMKSCKTKEDVEKLKMNKMNSFLSEAKSVMNNPNIPKGKKLGLMEKILRRVMGIEKEYVKFVNSGRYHNLPTQEELAEEEKKKAEQSEAAAEELGEAAEDRVQDQKNSSETPETDQAEGMDVKTPEIDGNIAEDSQEREEYEEYTFLELRQAADVVFQEIETELRGYLKAYRP